MCKAKLKKNNLQRRVVAWLATAALLMHALVPGLSYAFAHAPVNSGWIEICTSSGSKWLAPGVSYSTDSSTSHTGTGSSSQHCPYCSNGSLVLVLPSSVVSWLPAAPLSFVLPYIARPFPATQISLCGQARAPPLQS